MSKRGDWLDRYPGNNRRSITDATFYSTSIIREVLPAPGITPLHNIVHLRPLQCAGIEACPHLNALDRWNTHQRQRQPCIQTPVPLPVTSQPTRHPPRYPLKYPPPSLSL